MSRYPKWEPINHPRYKYRLTERFQHCLVSAPEVPPNVKLRVLRVTWAAVWADGVLQVERGYAWDGASGPAVDTMDFARGSLVHDVLLQMIADGALPAKPWKRYADGELYRIIREDGMPLFRAWWVWAAVRLFGGYGRYHGV